MVERARGAHPPTHTLARSSSSCPIGARPDEPPPPPCVPHAPSPAHPLSAPPPPPTLPPALRPLPCLRCVCVACRGPQRAQPNYDMEVDIAHVLAVLTAELGKVGRGMSRGSGGGGSGGRETGCNGQCRGVLFCGCARACGAGSGVCATGHDHSRTPPSAPLPRPPPSPRATQRACPSQPPPRALPRKLPLGTPCHSMLCQRQLHTPWHQQHGKVCLLCACLFAAPPPPSFCARPSPPRAQEPSTRGPLLRQHYDWPQVGGAALRP